MSITAGSSGSTHPNSPANWRTIDLLTTAVLGVAFGIVYWGWSTLYTGVLSTPVTGLFGPLVAILAGPWLIAGVVAGLVVRRPGAALMAEFLAASVEPVLGNEWGPSTLYSGLFQGLGVELALAIFLFRRFTVGVAMLGGVLAAVLECALYEWWAYYGFWSWGYKLAYLGFFAISGAIVAGFGGWLLTRALARSGAIDALAGGQQDERLTTGTRAG